MADHDNVGPIREAVRLHSATSYVVLPVARSPVLIHPWVKVILFVRAFLFSFVNMFFFSSPQHPPYSGRPEDYVGGVKAAVEVYPMWPYYARRFIEISLSGMTQDDGVEALTAMVVDDSTGYMKMMNFAKPEKKAIVHACLARKDYVDEVVSQVGKCFR